MSQAHVTIKGHIDIPGLDCHLRHCAELAPHLGSTVGLILMLGNRKAISKGMSVGELALPLVCYREAWVRERCPLPALTTCNR